MRMERVFVSRCFAENDCTVCGSSFDESTTDRDAHTAFFLNGCRTNSNLRFFEKEM